MYRNPNRPFSQSRAPIFRPAPAVPVPAITPAEVGKVDREHVLREQAASRASVRRGINQSWQLVDYNIGLWSNIPGPADAQTIATYTVPELNVLEVDRFGVWWSDPWLATSGMVDLYVLVGSMSPLNWIESGGSSAPGLLQPSFGDFFDPPKVRPLYLNAGDVLSVVARRVDTTFVGHASCMVKLIGTLYPTAGGTA